MVLLIYNNLWMDKCKSNADQSCSIVTTTYLIGIIEFLISIRHIKISNKKVDMLYFVDIRRILCLSADSLTRLKDIG